jgi:DNA-binding NarL/FixJ family response regulator
MVVDDRLRVVVADDDVTSRAVIAAALEQGGFSVCGEAGDARTAVAEVEAKRPDIVLLDIEMPGNGIRAASEISLELPEVAIVMLTVSRTDKDLFDSLRAGASGYLLKNTDPIRLPIALRGVLSGEAALPRTLTARLIQEFRSRHNRRWTPVVGHNPVRLTRREWEVLDLMGEGATTAEIAKRLFVSPGTVRSHVAAILRKLQVTSREEAIRLLQDEQ